MASSVVLPTVILLVSFLLPAARGMVVQLNSNNFDQYVTGDTFAFVEFYTPWCGHCKKLAPAYEEVGDAFNNVDSVLIAKVDADAEKSLGSRFRVRGYPTIKYFPQGSTEAQDYTGGRTAADIIDFINSKSEVRGRMKKEVSHVIDLNPSNFDDIVLNPDKNVLVEFYAPWCGHCKSLAPIYEEVGTTFSGDEDCVVARLDADGNRETAAKYGITGFPTIKFFSKTNKEGDSYERGRSTADFVKFLNAKCETKRLPGGALSEDAGVVEELNSLANRFMSSSDERDSILTEAEQMAQTHEDPDALYYVKVMKKVQNKGDEYINTEQERLGRILNGDVSTKKTDEITKKRNVLRKFEL